MEAHALGLKPTTKPGAPENCSAISSGVTNNLASPSTTTIYSKRLNLRPDLRNDISTLTPMTGSLSWKPLQRRTNCWKVFVHPGRNRGRRECGAQPTGNVPRAIPLGTRRGQGPFPRFLEIKDLPTQVRDLERSSRPPRNQGRLQHLVRLKCPRQSWRRLA